MGLKDEASNVQYKSGMMNGNPASMTFIIDKNVEHPLYKNRREDKGVFSLK